MHSSRSFVFALNMADAVISGVVGDVVGRVISLLSGHLQDRRGVEEKHRQLRHLVLKLESVVEAADARRVTSRALLAWLSELVDAAYQGRCFLDAFQREGGPLEIISDEDDNGEGGPRQSSFLPSSLNPAKRLRVAARRLILRGGGSELDRVLTSLQSLSGDLAEFILLLQGCPPAVYRPLTTNIYADIQMFGRHVERRRVLDFLLHDGDVIHGDLGVLPVIGRHGMGKTTLVQHVCDDPAVRRRFPLIVLLDFHCTSLITAANETAQLLRSLFTVPGTATSASLAGALSLLERKLRSKRFLVVFDNVDEHRRHVIQTLMPSLRRGRRGSRVVVTGTNASHVAGLGTVDPVTLRQLPPAEYWSFFKAHAFGGAADARLAAVGQAVAARLQGSFLGGKVVGALMRSRGPDHRVWRALLASCYADPSWLRSSGHVAAAATSLLPAHVTVRAVAVSGAPVRGLVVLDDAALVAPPTHHGGTKLPVLLCKSVFPFYCLYYTAYCAIGGESSKQ